MRSSFLCKDQEIIAFFAALVFAVHPLMTEAVTYLVQRLVSLSTMFFLISFIFYLCIRSGQLSHSGKTRVLSGFVISCLLAFFTRENTWVLPLLLLASEKTFFKHSPGHQKWFSGLLILNVFIFLLILIYVIGSDKYFKPIPPVETHNFTITAPVYYLTQICVICSYLKLLIIPAGQVFDRDFPVVFSITEEPVILCSFLLLAYIIILFSIRKKQPILFFSLLWFLITILPQSVVPRPNVFFEHRLYLPSAGIFIFIVNLIFIAGRHWGKTPRLIFFILIPVLIILTISRNLVWHDELRLWKDTVSKSPGNPRAWSNLGHAEYNRQNYPAAESDFNRAVKILPRKAEFWYNLALAEQMQLKPQQAVNSISQAIRFDPGKAMYYHDRGVIYAMNRNYPQAITDFSKAISLEPGLRSALLNRARVYELIGDTTLRQKDIRAAGN
jgi:protein O-mannosyl-transferase